MIQFFNSEDVETLLLAHAITIKLFPVNNSAPATTTSTNPRLNRDAAD